METRLIYLKETLTVHSIVDGEGSVSHFPSDTYGIVSGDANDVLKAALVLNIDLSPIFDFFITNNIIYAMTPEKIKILKDRAVGIQFTADIIDRLKNTDGLTKAQRLTLLNVVKDGINSLMWGDIVVSREVFNALALTALWTQARKDWVLSHLDTYINS